MRTAAIIYEFLAFLALLLSILCLCAGKPGLSSISDHGFVSYNTTGLRAYEIKNGSTTTQIADWYEVYFFTSCLSYLDHESTDGQMPTKICTPQHAGYTFNLSAWVGVSKVPYDHRVPDYIPFQYIDQTTNTALALGLYMTGIIFTGLVICFSPIVIRGQMHINAVVFGVALIAAVFLVVGGAKTTNLDGGYNTNISEGDVVTSTDRPSKSLLALLWIPPVFMIISCFTILVEYDTQGWTPYGQTIDAKWTPAQNPDAKVIQDTYESAKAEWKKNNPDDEDGPPKQLYESYKAEKKIYKATHAVSKES